MVERAYGDIAPEKIVGKKMSVKEERNRMLAFMFMRGANRIWYGGVLKGIVSQYALGVPEFPQTVEEALEALTLIDESRVPRRVEKDDERKVTLVQHAKSQRIKCWKCGKTGHKKQDCPEEHNDDDDILSEGVANANVPYWAGGRGA